MDSPLWLKPEEVPEVEVLTESECWSALEKAPIGRLAVRAGDGVDVFPVNFTITDQVIYLRSAPGSKLVDIAHASSVAFEADGSRRRRHWSVVVHGTAERLSDESDIRQSGVLDLPTMTSSAKWSYVRITPHSISGLRFKSRRDR
jgi:nitroimidazol reductase NimA-like FMN-containing flavoprotein (pyridoxamine 5'-phosphate oxidase superfamily)